MNKVDGLKVAVEDNKSLGKLLDARLLPKNIRLYELLQ